MDNQRLFEEALNVDSKENSYYAGDCRRIAQVAKDYFEIKITLAQAEDIWKEYSENMAAGWMMLDSDEQIAHQISYWIYQRTGDSPQEI